MNQVFQLNLYQLPNEELIDKKVSSQSLWYDSKWVFDGGVAGRKPYDMTVDWSIILSDESRLTDAKHVHILDAAKRFIWSLKVDPPAGFNFIKNQTIVKSAYPLLDLIRWMIRNNYSAFSELDAAACNDYLEYLRDTRRNRFGNRLLAKSLHSYLHILTCLYRQRDKLADAIREEPFGGLNSYKVAKQSGAQQGWIPYIPDKIALASLGHTLEWLEWRADDIIRLLQIYLDASSKGTNKQQVRRAVHQAITEFEFSTLPGKSTSWHARLANIPQVRALVDDLVDACANALFGFVGMRLHEVLGLETHCVETRSSLDGLLEIFYLAGHTSKTSEQAVQWVAGARLTGTKDVPPPVRAVQILEAIFAPWREMSKSSKLFLVFNGGVSISKTSEHVDFMSNVSMSRRLDKFNQKYVPLPSEWHFTSHQWRKTFARFVAMTDKSALSALSQHFLHISIAMTDRGYIGNDFELEELIDEMTRAETADILTTVLLHGKAVAGRLGEELQEKHKVLKVHFHGMTIEDVQEEIEWIVKDSGMSVHSCEWGWCMYRQENSRCEGGSKGPDPAKRGPSVCGGCGNLLVEEKHRPWWQDRLDRNAALLEHLSDAPELQKVAPLDRVGECKRVLGMLDHKMEKPDVTTAS